MTRPTTTIQIVTWNSGRYLPSALRSIFSQTLRDFSVLLIDNASTDGSIEWVRRHYPHVHLLRNASNAGYSRGHNQALQLQHSQFVVVMNPDVVLSPDLLAQTIAALRADVTLAAVCGKVRRFHFSNSDLKEIIDDGIIDATGLTVRRSFQVQNTGAGEPDQRQFDRSGETFGPPGALAVFRRAALDSVASKGHVFDERMFAYKEDVDLAWRLQHAGWRTGYVAGALALHFREAKDDVTASDRAIMRARRSKKALVNYLSYRNHILVIMKNVPRSMLWRNLPWWLWYELKKFVYLVSFERRTLSVVRDVIRLAPSVLAERRLIQSRSKRTSQQLQGWLV